MLRCINLSHFLLIILFRKPFQNALLRDLHIYSVSLSIIHSTISPQGTDQANSNFALFQIKILQHPTSIHLLPPHHLCPCQLKLLPFITLNEHDLINLIKNSTFSKGEGSCIDLILTNRNFSFKTLLLLKQA